MEQQYIAFISYRHTEVDTAAAIQIQQLIEHYKIPAKLRKDGNSRLGKVFRDTDELNVSSDLSESLCTALDHSAYLLVLCSPQYKESEWCRREILYFLKNHDIDHILPILVNGDPATAFPEELFRSSIVDGEEVLTEPLAANIASDSIKGMKQNLSREYLRIVSRMLDCRYDDLVQRQKRYERQRRFIGLGTAFSVLLAFIIMLLVKNAQINARYLESQRNQARYLSKMSLEQYAQGDRQSALESALAVLPEGHTSGPVVPEQMYALSNGVNAYQTAYVPSDNLELPDGNNHCFSEEGKYLFVYSVDELHVVDMGTKEVCYYFRSSDFAKEHPDLTNISSASGINQVLPEGETGFFIRINSTLLHLDLKDPAAVETKEFSYPVQRMAYAKGKLAVSSESNLLILDWASGKPLIEKDFNGDCEETHTTYTIEDLAWNEDASSLAVGFDYFCTDIENKYHNDPEKNREEEAFFKEHAPMGLVLVDPTTEQITRLSSERSENLCFENHAVGALHRRYPFTVIKTSFVLADTVKQYHACVYDAESGKCFFTGDTITVQDANTFGFSAKRTLVNGESKEIYLLWIGKTATILDAKSRDILFQETFHEDVVAMTSFKDNLTDLILRDGSIQHVSLGESENIRLTVLHLDVTVEDAWVVGQTYYILASGRMIICTNQNWEDYTTVKAGDPSLASLNVGEIQYQSTKQGTLRLVQYEAEKYGSDAGEGCRGVEVYPVLSDELLFSYRTEEVEGQILKAFLTDDGQQILILEEAAVEATAEAAAGTSVETTTEVADTLTDSSSKTAYNTLTGNPDQTVYLTGYRLSDGSQIFRYDLSACDEEASAWIRQGALTSYSSAYGLTSDGSVFWGIGAGEVHTFDLSGETIAHAAIKRDSNIDYPTMSRDGKYLIWLEKSTGEHAETSAYILLAENLETKEITETELPPQIEQFSYTSQLLPVKDSQVLLYTGATALLYFDAKTASFLSAMSIRTGSTPAVLENSQELLVAHDTKLTLYDLDTFEEKSYIELTHPVSSLVTDAGTERIAAVSKGSYSSENDAGWYPGGVEVIYIDSDRQMYREAFFMPVGDTVSICPSEGEIALRDLGMFEYDHMHSFEELKEKAEELLVK